MIPSIVYIDGAFLRHHIHAQLAPTPNQVLLLRHQAKDFEVSATDLGPIEDAYAAFSDNAYGQSASLTQISPTYSVYIHTSLGKVSESLIH